MNPIHYARTCLWQAHAEVQHTQQTLCILSHTFFPSHSIEVYLSGFYRLSGLQAVSCGNTLLIQLEVVGGNDVEVAALLGSIVPWTARRSVIIALHGVVLYKVIWLPLGEDTAACCFSQRVVGCPLLPLPSRELKCTGEAEPCLACLLTSSNTVMVLVGMYVGTAA